MRSSPILALFADAPAMRRGPSAFVISLLLHGVACCLLYFGINQVRRIDPRSAPDRYTVRIMQLTSPNQKMHRATDRQLAYSASEPGHSTAIPGAATEPAPAARIPPNLIAQTRAVQTLIQPDAKPDLVMTPAVLPQLLAWSAPNQKIKEIVTPPAPKEPQKVSQPSLDTPNQELRVADLKLSPSPSEVKLSPLTASTTAPLAVQSPGKTSQVTQTATKNSGRPSPASVISLSEIRVQEGTAALPMINEVAPAPFPDSLAPGLPKSFSGAGHGQSEAAQNGKIAGESSRGQTGEASQAAGSNGQGDLSGAAEEPGVVAGSVERTTLHITLPKDGKFGVVVVGSSLAEEYPETVHLWSGRLAYTVYLHVGLSKNWILQYSLPRAQQASSAGNSNRLEAPWPYDITRPSIDEDSGSDAIMVHGFVNAAGRFEQLAVIFPEELTEAKFLLHALQQWQFRAAMQNAQATAVEVLLIIPDQAE